LKTEWVNHSYGQVHRVKRLYKGKTKFQNMEINESPTFGTMLYLDGKVQISDGDENRYHQYLVSAPILAHANPKSVLIIGGGDCFSIEEAVKFRGLKRILMVEIDKGVVDFCRKHYPPIEKCLRDKRVDIVYDDARKWLEDNDEKFDVLVVDLTEPHGPSKMLYTKEFYQLCASRLNPGGLLSIHTDNYFLFPDSFATIFKTLNSVFKHVATARIDMPCFGMGWSYRMASKQPINIKRLDSRHKALERSGKALAHFTASSYLLEATKEERDILKSRGRISTDAKPFDKFEKLPKYVTR